MSIVLKIARMLSWWAIIVFGVVSGVPFAVGAGLFFLVMEVLSDE